MSPWKPIEEMDHDELRRYARDLIHSWGTLPKESDNAAHRAALDAVGLRMEALGIKPLVSLKVDAR